MEASKQASKQNDNQSSKTTSILSYRQIKNIIENQKAFSLIGVMIAAAIMGALAILFTEMTQNQQSATTLMESKLLELTMYRDIESYLSNSNACKNTLIFKGPSNAPEAQEVKPFGSPSEREVHTIRNSKSHRVYHIGALYFNKSLQIKKMTVEPTPSFSSTDPTGVIDFVLTFKRKKVSASAFSEKTYKIPMRVNLNNNQIIDSCEMKGTLPVCSSGEFLTANSAGNFQCEAPLNYSQLNCPNGEVFQGFHPNGEKNCVAKASSSGRPCQDHIFLNTSSLSTSAINCKVYSSPHGTISGECKGSTGSSCGGVLNSHGHRFPCKIVGSCKYECNNGNWIKRNNTCWQH